MEAADFDPPKFPESVARSLVAVDEMPQEYRTCVHELGWESVSAMLPFNLTPNQMRQITHACWSAPRSAHQRPGGHGETKKSQPSIVLQHLDTLLSRAGANISAIMLLAFLKRHNMVVLPIPANSVMVEASIATVRITDDRMTKTEKHKRRLEAAITAGAARLWPEIFRGNN